MEQVSNNLIFGGEQRRYQHRSSELNCDMHFSIFLPPQASKVKVPQVYWLSGLTCTDENFVQKAGAQQYAADHGVAVIAPDTSPRGKGIPDDEDAAWDFGLGAGFYIDASENPWSNNYRMYSYITSELPELINDNFPVLSDRVSIMGHSMGGHGALTIALKNSGHYQSVSAFAPICAPTQCPWGHKAFGNYIGPDQTQWLNHDTCELISSNTEKLHLLVDQGSADNFLAEQLKPDLLEKACNDNDHPLTLRMQEGYDHSYFFIASFMRDHIEWHARHLNSQK